MGIQNSIWWNKSEVDSFDNLQVYFSDISKKAIRHEDVEKFLMKSKKLRWNNKLHQKNDMSYKKYKKLGIFLLEEKELPRSIISLLEEEGIYLNTSKVFELHVPPQKASMNDLRISCEKMREYITKHAERKDMPEYIYWISYLSYLAHRRWFTTFSLPQEVKEKTICYHSLLLSKKDYYDTMSTLAYNFLHAWDAVPHWSRYFTTSESIDSLIDGYSIRMNRIKERWQKDMFKRYCDAVLSESEKSLMRIALKYDTDVIEFCFNTTKNFINADEITTNSKNNWYTWDIFTTLNENNA